jgi:hypothetical protein
MILKKVCHPKEIIDQVEREDNQLQNELEEKKKIVTLMIDQENIVKENLDVLRKMLMPH